MPLRMFGNGARRWHVPVGPHALSPAPPFNDSVPNMYIREVFRAYITGLQQQGVFVFVRNSLPEEIRSLPEYASLFDTGKLGWFHTSSEIEPRKEVSTGL